ncbi:probable glutamate 5-kinase [Desulfotalea psychrophila LSv54]|nr:probable glutamate 5-kinase [Desulfotalea psychrophila LSv54]
MMVDVTEELQLRREIFDKARRVVVKVGSAILTNVGGIHTSFIADLAREISYLRQSGHEVILVSSGAVAAGRKKISWQDSAPLGMKEKQALAAIGQSHLMRTYEEAFGFYELDVAQILLTHADLSHRDRYLNIRNTILTLLKFGVTPIINENDTVSVEELKFGDNDTLAALLTNLLEADICICLTDVDALYDKNPQKDPTARPLHIVTKISPEIEAMAGNSNSLFGTGGMQSKIRAAKIVFSGGGTAIIGPGRAPRVLQRLFAGEDIGTIFLPCKERMKSKKQWIAHVLKPKGTLLLDAGACKALLQGGKSLLPSGIVGISGEFDRGDSVNCCRLDGSRIAVGLVNYASVDVNAIKGLQSREIASVLKCCDNEEVIHRDNLVILS